MNIITRVVIRGDFESLKTLQTPDGGITSSSNGFGKNRVPLCMESLDIE